LISLQCHPKLDPKIRVFRARSQDNYLASSRTCASCENSIHINNIILWLAFIFRSPSQDLFLLFFWPPVLATQIGVGSILVGYPNSRPRRTFHFSYQQFSARLVEFCLNVFTIDYTRVKKTRRNPVSGERWRGQSHCQPPKSDCFVLVTSISKPRPAPKKLPLWQSANVNWEGSLIFIFHSICNLRCLRQLLLYSYGNSHSPAKLLLRRLLLLMF